MKNEFKDGFTANIPIAFSVFVYGWVLGVLCVPKGIALHELVLMNVFIFAGSAQFVMIEMWSNSLDVLGITVAALMINLRYFLITASLNPLFIHSSKKEKFKYIHFVTDECWAITMNRLKTQKITPLFLLAGGLCIFIFWFCGTLMGFFLGEFIKDPKIYALDFAFIAIFTALSFNMYKGKEDLLPFFVAALSSIICEYYLPGKLYIIVGALSASLCAVIISKKEKCYV